MPSDSDSIAAQVDAFDYRHAPATRRSGVVPSPSAIQRELWLVGAGRLRGRQTDLGCHDRAAKANRAQAAE